MFGHLTMPGWVHTFAGRLVPSTHVRQGLIWHASLQRCTCWIVQGLQAVRLRWPASLRLGCSWALHQ